MLVPGCLELKRTHEVRKSVLQGASNGLSLIFGGTLQRALQPAFKQKALWHADRSRHVRTAEHSFSISCLGPEILGLYGLGRFGSWADVKTFRASGLGR